MTYKYIFFCGSDTFINIPKLQQYLTQFNSDDFLYIGGHGDYRQVHDENIYFHSGGAGSIVSRPLVKSLYPMLANMFKSWKKIVTSNSQTSNKLVNACDVAISYFIQKYVKSVKIIKNSQFYLCNYLGLTDYDTCCCKNSDMKRMITCHFMKLQDFDDFMEILQKNNYFLEEHKHHGSKKSTIL